MNGHLVNVGLLRGCYVEGGSVSGDHQVGGLVGFNEYGLITHCYSIGSVSGSSAGGLVGWNQGTISNCYSTGNVGYRYAGGLVGYNYGDVADCYSTASVSGGDCLGGLAGEHFSTSSLISNCYAAGPVSGSGSYVGGLVGNNRYGTYNKCFWDNTVNPLLEGVGNIADPVDVIGEPTANLQTETTFTDAGWDFVGETTNGTEDIWRLCNDGAEYPHLNWEYPPGDFGCPDGVDMFDFAVLGDAWMSEVGDLNWEAGCDISEPEDEVIDGLDLAAFVNNWLAN